MSNWDPNAKPVPVDEEQRQPPEEFADEAQMQKGWQQWSEAARKLEEKKGR